MRSKRFGLEPESESNIKHKVIQRTALRILCLRRINDSASGLAQLFEGADIQAWPLTLRFRSECFVERLRFYDMGALYNAQRRMEH